MTDKEAMAMALEALECANSPNGDYENEIAALKERLTQPEQEPVAWQWLGSAHFRKKLPKNADVTAWNPLYSAPQRSWVGLS